jgi:hypothetical protein
VTIGILDLRPRPNAADLVVLGAVDVPEMLDLVARTRPGPFEPETYRLGTYLGVRRAGWLVAMAGERLHPPGYTEISAVCTDPGVRGQGLASTPVHRPDQPRPQPLTGQGSASANPPEVLLHRASLGRGRQRARPVGGRSVRAGLSGNSGTG